MVIVHESVTLFDHTLRTEMHVCGDSGDFLRTKQKVGTFTKIYKLQCNGYVNDYVDI
jgi:hypothetical protein